MMIHKIKIDKAYADAVLSGEKPFEVRANERRIQMRLINADELITAFPCGESIRTESVRATINHMLTIEVSEDAISREDAVNALIAHFIPQTYTGEQVEQASKLAWKIMANAPSVIPSRAEGEWIPCNERLPERDGCYLATLHIKWPDREYKTVEVEEFRNGGFNERSYARVAAWMPLPEPWKGADNV